MMHDNIYYAHFAYGVQRTFIIISSICLLPFSHPNYWIYVTSQ